MLRTDAADTASTTPETPPSASPPPAFARLVLNRRQPGDDFAADVPSTRRPIFYGWVMLIVTTLATMATSPGQSFMVGTFSESIRADLGISLGGFSAAYMIATFAASLPLTLVGRLGDRFGTRAVMGAVAALLGLACVFIGVGTAAILRLGLPDDAQRIALLVTLTVAFFLLRFLGQGALGLVASHALAMWFERRLGIAEAVRHMGMPLAVAALPAVTLVLIDALGWRGAYAVLGAGVWLVVLPAVWLTYVNRPEDVGQHLDGRPATLRGSHSEPPAPDAADQPSTSSRDHAATPDWADDRADIELDAPSIGEAGDMHGHAEAADRTTRTDEFTGGVEFTLREAMTTQAYWIVTASMVLSSAVGTAFVFHTQPMMADLGSGRAAAAAVVGTLGVVTLIVTLPYGVLVDRVRPARLLPVSTLFLAGACGCYALAASLPGDRGPLSLSWTLLAVHVGFGLLGLSQGMLWLLASPIFARYFGRRHHGAIRGSLTTFMVIGTSAGPFVFATWRELTGSFTDPYAWTGAAAVPLVIWALFLKRPPNPRGGRGSTVRPPDSPPADTHAQ
jgi:MFS family permease